MAVEIRLGTVLGRLVFFTFFSSWGVKKTNGSVTPHPRCRCILFPPDRFDLFSPMFLPGLQNGASSSSSSSTSWSWSSFFIFRRLVASHSGPSIFMAIAAPAFINCNSNNSSNNSNNNDNSNGPAAKVKCVWLRAFHFVVGYCGNLLIGKCGFCGTKRPEVSCYFTNPDRSALFISSIKMQHLWVAINWRGKWNNYHRVSTPVIITGIWTFPNCWFSMNVWIFWGYKWNKSRSGSLWIACRNTSSIEIMH